MNIYRITSGKDDMEKKPKVRLLGKEMRMNCLGMMNIINYFNKTYNVPAEKLLKELPFGLEYVNNISNWMDNWQVYRFYLNCMRSVKNLMHTGWQNIGEQIYSENIGYFRFLFRLLPLDMIFSNLPKYVQSVSKWGDCEIVNLKKGEATFMLRPKSDELRDKFSVGGECSYTIGVINSIPRVKNEAAYTSEAAHEICSMPLHVLVKNSYNMDPSAYGYTDTGFQIKGSDIGKWIVLKPHPDNNKYLGRNFEFSTREKSNAIGITKDVFHDGLKIFSEGEIYNAPYCVFRVSYKKRFFIGEHMSNRKMIIFLEKQLQLTDEKVRQATWARQEAEETLEEVKKRDEIITSYMRYSILDEVYSGGNPLEFKPLKKCAAIMFADIRDFTTISENMDPMQITEFLNIHFSRMNEPIVKNNGEIDKLMGDGAMVVFADSADSVKAAIEMQHILKKEGKSILSNSIIPLKMGIGIHFDEIVEGNIGAKGSRLDRTIIGDGVNIASRLESLTKFYLSGILITDHAREQFCDEFKLRKLDFILVKGKTKPVEVYEVLDAQDDAEKEFKISNMDDYIKAVNFYSVGDFRHSLEIFRDLKDRLAVSKKKNPALEDPIIDIYTERLIELLNHVNDSSFMDNWDGVYRHTEK